MLIASQALSSSQCLTSQMLFWLNEICVIKVENRVSKWCISAENSFFTHRMSDREFIRGLGRGHHFRGTLHQRGSAIVPSSHLLLLLLQASSGALEVLDTGTAGRSSSLRS